MTATSTDDKAASLPPPPLLYNGWNPQLLKTSTITLINGNIPRPAGPLCVNHIDNSVGYKNDPADGFSLKGGDYSGQCECSGFRLLPPGSYLLGAIASSNQETPGHSHQIEPPTHLWVPTQIGIWEGEIPPYYTSFPRWMQWLPGMTARDPWS